MVIVSRVDADTGCSTYQQYFGALKCNAHRVQLTEHSMLPECPLHTIF